MTLDLKPLYPKAGWKKNEKSKEKALKSWNWYKGAGKEKSGNKIPKVKAGLKRRCFLRSGDRLKLKNVATVVFVPSTKGSTLLKSLRDDEQCLTIAPRAHHQSQHNIFQCNVQPTM